MLHGNSVATEELPVIVLGAGPIGLAAAVHLADRGLPAVVLEAGADVGASVREWGHVRLFSPWRYLVDPLARRLLTGRGWEAPDPDGLPTGKELVRDYLEPLAKLPEIAGSLRFGHVVTAVTRNGFDKLKSSGRDREPFVVTADTASGQVKLLGRAVLDATGTWSRPNPMGAGGVPAVGEEENAPNIRYGIPDAVGADRPRYEGKRTLVVGNGHSAINAVLALAALAEASPETEVIWAIRGDTPHTVAGSGQTDDLPERARLGTRARSLVDSSEVAHLTGFRVERIARDTRGLTVTSHDGRSVAVDEIVVATGFRPELGLTRELRLELDPVTEAPVRLAPLIDPNVHSCGSVKPHGQAELSHPERDYYTVGMKSYGRAPTFLLLTGYEQVRSIVAHVAGDLEAASRVELSLPAGGACGTRPGVPGGACCATSVDLIEVEASVPAGAR